MPLLECTGAEKMGKRHLMRMRRPRAQSLTPDSRRDCPSQREKPCSSRWDDSRPGKGERVPVTAASGMLSGGALNQRIESQLLKMNKWYQAWWLPPSVLAFGN